MTKEKKERTPAQKAAQFQPGETGNPKGRTPVHPDVKEAAKAYTIPMLEVLVDVALRGKNETSRVNAAVAVWNRAWGAPKQSVDVDVTHKQDWSALLNALDAHNAAKALTTPDQPLVIEGQLIEEKSE